MITSTLKSANAARRRVRGLQCAVAANPPVRIAASRLPPHTTRAFDDLRGARAHAIALVVLAVHCTVALKAWRVSVENLEYTAPHALDLQFDVGATVPPLAAISTQSAGRTADLAPAMTSPAPSPSISPRRARDMATPRNTAQASPLKPLAKTAPNNESKWQPAPSNATPTTTPQPMPTDTGRELLNPSTAKSPDSQPAQEPLTEPSFGAAYLRNPPPTYPGVAQQRGWQGTVLLKVHVLASGRPDHVGLASSSGHDSLDDAALEAVTNWRFAPARRGDQAIDGWVQVPIEFKLGT
jgi:protein TonB